MSRPWLSATFQMGLSFVWCIVRAALALRFVLSNTAPAVFFGCLELSAVVLTIRNLSRAGVSKRWEMQLVPMCYLAPLLLKPGTPVIKLWGTLLVFAVLWQAALRLRMGTEISISTPTFSRLLSKGIYGKVRHPLAASSLVVSALFVGTYPSARNLLLFPLVVAAEVLAVVVEERYLLRASPAYADYSQRVPWRFWPGLA